MRGLATGVASLYCENMKNVTVSLDDQTYRNAKVRAAEMDKSLSAIVREFLASFGAHQSEFERLKLLEQEMRAKLKGSGFSAGDRLSRDDLYDRAIAGQDDTARG